MRLINGKLNEVHTTRGFLSHLLDTPNFSFNKANQEPIRLFEDVLARRGNAFFRVYSEDLARTEVERYLLLTSLPYVIDHRDVPDILIGTRIRGLWAAGVKKCHSCPGVVKRLTVPTGNLYPKVVLIAEAPGVGDGKKDSYDRALVYGNTSHLLRQSLNNVNLYFQCWFTNLLKCALPNNREGTLSEYTKCFPYLHHEINTLKPELIILFGSKVQSFFKTRGLKCKNRKIEKDGSGILGGALVASLPHPTSYLYRCEGPQLALDIQSLTREVVDA